MNLVADTSPVSQRIFFAKVFVCLGLFALGSRLWYLQCIQGSYYRDLSENNRRRTVRTVAPRGIIYDREGKVLVRNRPAYSVALMLEDTPDVKASVYRLAEITERDPEKLYAQFQSRRKGLRFEPQVVLRDVSREELARIKVQTHNLPGVIISVIPTRSYPHQELAAQLVGYTREISRSQLEKKKTLGYSPGDMVGQSGLEKVLEEDLRGDPGFIQVEVDARGRRRKELGIVDDHPGSDLHLSIDLDLQKVAQAGLAEKSGAIVAMDPRDGDVLVLASAPSFDVNAFSGQMLLDEWERLAKDKKKPLTNRAIASVYPPGSTLKLLWAVAGLAEQVIDTHTVINCPGYYKFAGRRYHCHKRSGHGPVRLSEAITMSCNAYFFQLGQKLGIDRMYDYMKMFGIGQSSEIVLPGEELGTLPSEDWKRKRFGERWYPGDTLPVSIGQGYIVMTPLQLVLSTAAIANGGKLYAPRVVTKVVDSYTGEITERAPKLLRSIDIPKSVFDEVRSYASLVVNDEQGTGKRAALPGITVAGKTGTAQVSRLGKEKLGDKYKDHAWFVAFAPAENPEIALAVVVEHSGHGGVHAAPIAHDILATYFRKRGMLDEPPADAEEKEAS